MRTFVAAFVAATIVAALLTPLVRLLALRLGAVATPSRRHVHQHSIPRLGGIALAIAVIAPLAALFLVDSAVALTIRASAKMVIGLFVGATVMCVVGALDDTRGLRALHKLLAQVACAAIAFACGFRIEAISLPVVGTLSMGIFALPVTTLWIVGVTNAVNLIDGLDGLAAGVVFFAAVTNFVVAIMAGSILVATFMAAMMGALVGFLFYNFNPARIFMGDSGSYFLGFVLASTSLAGTAQKTSTTVALLVPIVALGVPIFDTLFSLVRRWFERRPLFSPDRGHVHHRLLDMGITHRRAVLILYGISVVLTAAAIGISLGRSWEVGVALLAATAVMLGLVRSVGYFEYLQLRKRQKARLYDHSTERLRKLFPQLSLKLSASRTESEILDALEQLASNAELVSFELIRHGPGAGEEECLHRFENSAVSAAKRGLVSARYPIGRDDNARATLKFAWKSDGDDVSAQADILLQLVTDFVEHALRAAGSSLAPAPARHAQRAAVADAAVEPRPSQ